MGLFRKKPDPITERAKALNHQIAALEAEIKRLADQPEKIEHAPAPPPAPAPAPPRSPFTPVAPPSSIAAPPLRSQGKPRLRSTALPQGPGANVPAAPARVQEPIFEEVDQERISFKATPADIEAIKDAVLDRRCAACRTACARVVEVGIKYGSLAHW